MAECPLLAQSGHDVLRRTCPLSGVKRTLPLALHMSAFDPKRTSAGPGRHGTGRAIVRWDFVLMLSFMRLLVLGENVG